MKRKFFLLLMLAIAVLFLKSNTSYAYPTSYYLNIERVEQERSNWCWVASSVAVLDHYGRYVSQSDFCRTVKGYVTNQTASAFEVSDGLYDYGLNSSVIRSYLDLESIKTQIYYYNRPIIMGWIWNSGGGHMLVLEGFSTYQEERLSYMDPWDGRYHYASYSYIRGGYYSDHSWDETVYRFR